MKIHEYQAKQLMVAKGIPVPEGRVATTPEEAVAAVRPLVEATGNPVVVVKSQIHAGGRGKGTFKEFPDVGGVSVVTNGIEGGVEAAEARVEELAERMLGSTLVTIQTGPEGKQVNRLYVEQGIDIGRELYLSIVLDRAVGRTRRDGLDRRRDRDRRGGGEHTGEDHPADDRPGDRARRVAGGGDRLWVGAHRRRLRQRHRFLTTLAAAASQWDTDLIEINPLVVTTGGEVMALDGKMSFDANALFRHPELAELRDPTEEDPAEIEASSHGLSYVKMDGTIGCMVNGAGLAMSTMDIIKYVGGQPANFLDVGGGADAEQVAAAFRIITKDPNVRGIFVNIFGGIMRCDTIATGVVEAVRQVGLEVPLVVRLEGTNVELGKQIIDESGLDVVNASDMLEGARKIVELAS